MSDKLLIIDDDVLICETLYDIFQGKGYYVTLANTGQEAIEKAEKIAFNVVFIDIKLPDIDGITLLKKIKKFSPESLCIIVTAYATIQSAANALQDGADGYFLKPLMIHDIIKRVHDLLEKKRLEQELKKSEEKYRNIIENAKEGYYEVDLKGNFTFFNTSLCEQLNYSPEELMGMNYREYVVEENSRRTFQAFNQVYNTGIGQENFNYEFVTKEGKRIFGETSIYLKYDSNGRKIGFSGFLRDITKRKKTEQKLRESEESLLNAQRIAHIGNWNWDIVKNKLIWSDEIYRIYGLTPQDFGASYEAFLDSVYPDDREFVKKSVNKALYENKPYSIDHRIILPDGSLRFVHEQAEVVFDESNKAIKMNGTVHDITERMHAEQKIKESEEKYRTITDQSLIGVAVIQNNVFKYVNQKYAEIGGYTVEEMINWQPREVRNIVHPADREMVMTQSIKKQEGDKNVINQYTFRAISKTGETLWIKLYSKTIMYERKLAVLITIIDITERKQAERKLKESEEKSRNIINNISDVLMEGDTDGKITFISPQIFGIVGYHPNELIGSKFLEFLYPEHKEIYEKLINRALKAGSKFSEEFQIQHKKGYYIPISVKGSVEEVNEKLKFFIVISDITEQRKIDEMMKREIKKLKELDQIRSDLIRRISHELKTPLISIFSGSQYLLEHVDTNYSDQVQNIIQIIHIGGYRLRSLVNNLILAYNIESDEIKLNLTRENLIPMIKNCVKDIVFQANKRKNFINLELLEELSIKVDKSMIKKAISNILSNAVKNTPPNGNIFVSTFEHSKHIDIIVKDDGVGLTEDENLFLFKKFGKIERYGKGMDVDIEGAGLGLYNANEIVKLHHGEIIVKSKGRNKGSKFIIRLPMN